MNDKLKLIKKIEENKIKNIAIIGAGGKTTILYFLANYFKNKGPMLLGTSTQMYMPKEVLLLDNYKIKKGHKDSPKDDNIKFKKLSNKQKEIIKFLLIEKPFFIGIKNEKGKLASIDENSWKDILKFTKCSLYEADGSRRFPIKLPREYDPVLKYPFDAIIVVIGISSIGNQIKNITNSIEEIKKLLNTDEKHVLNEKDLAIIIEKGYIEPFTKKYNKPVFIVLNQCDNDNQIKMGKKIINYINKENNLIEFFITNFKCDELELNLNK